MKTFKEFMEGMPVHWNPSARIGHDPVVSALEKIQKNQNRMPFSSNFTGFDAFQTNLGLDREELDSLKNLRLFVKNENGLNIDKNKYINVYKQIRGFAPKIIDQNQDYRFNAPPPPKSNNEF